MLNMTSGINEIDFIDCIAYIKLSIYKISYLKCSSHKITNLHLKNQFAYC